MELTRKQVIEELERFRLASVYKSNKEKLIDKCLAYAISSLKTDEAYQIMYEGGEIFTKDDMVDLLKEILLEIEQCGVEDSHWIVKEKINALKGEKNGKNT